MATDTQAVLDRANAFRDALVAKLNALDAQIAALSGGLSVAEEDTFFAALDVLLTELESLVE